jgi:hypothetical protein
MAFTPTPDEEDLDHAVVELLQTLYVTATGPTTAQLLDYELGLATPADARLIEAYLTTTPAIRHELTQLQLLDQPGAVQSATAFPTRFLAWLRAQWPDHPPLLALPQQIPAIASALRGAAAAHAIYAVGDYRLALAIATTADHPAEAEATPYTVQGQLLSQAAPEAICTGAVQLIRLPATHDQTTEPVIAAETTLDAFGFFALPPVAGGVYQLVALLPQHTIWIQAINVP